jgi:hypothetical protein
MKLPTYEPESREDATLPADEVRAIESRAEVDSLGNLQYRRRQIIDAYAPLKALYGPFGLFDDRRKRLLESLKVRARMALAADGGKVTEGIVDATAYADPQYEKFLDDAYAAKVQYIRMENELSEIQERISSREAELYFVGKEMGLTR